MCSAEMPPKSPDPEEKPQNSGADPLEEQVRDLADKLAQSQQRAEALELELDQLRASALRASSNEVELRSLAEQVERQQMLLERDEQVARELQRNLRPVLEREVPGLTYALETTPGTHVGGDFFDIINLSDNFIAFLIADVSGTGLPAAVIMATGRLAFRTYAANEINPRVIMDNVNKAMLRSTLAGHYLTAFLGVLDTELLTLQYVNASHCSPFVIREGEAIPLDTEGLFVGMFEDPQYEQKGIQLEQFDRLFLYTDGLLKGFEGRDRHEQTRRLGDYLRENSTLVLKDLVARLSTRLEEPEDDVALLGIETLLEKAQRKVLTISSIPSEVTRVEDAILPVLSNKGYGERYIFATKLALEEAVINAIKHGNELDDTKRVTVSFSIDDDRAAISVGDEGEGFDPNTVPDPTLDENLIATSGRGLALIRAYMDEVRYNDTGTEITMIKYAPWAATKKHS
jgi:serine/threonine-protein kinase RsbW